MSTSPSTGYRVFHSTLSTYSMIKLWYRDEGSWTTSRRATIFGPPVKFRKILISRLIFLEATGLSTLMTQVSELAVSNPSNTYKAFGETARKKKKFTVISHLAILPTSYAINDLIALRRTPFDAEIVCMVLRGSSLVKSNLEFTHHSHTMSVPVVHLHWRRYEPSVACLSRQELGTPHEVANVLCPTGASS